MDFDLRLVLEEVNELLAHRADDRGIDLLLQYPPGLPRHFAGDAGRIRQVVTNLVANAVKFTNHGYVMISVECSRTTSETAEMLVAVTDTGAGIPEDKLQLLFRKFSQVDSSPTRKHGGTGLGLAISKQLIELMGGAIGVESRLGAGSKFWFSLPLRLQNRPIDATDLAADLRGLRVLIVDAIAVNRRLLHEQIAGWGMRSGSCGEPFEALAEIKAAQRAGDPYHFVLLDERIPQMDGVTLAHAIKDDPATRNCIVVLLTSVGRWSRRPLQGQDVDASLMKPVRESQLQSALETAWAKKTGIAAPVPAGVLLGSAEMKDELAALSRGVPVRVLVAEDNPVNQKVAAGMLERLGVRPDMAGDGREVLQFLDVAPYDLILMDCQMPEMDGYAATREIRRREMKGHHVPIVAMTAEAMAGAREACLEAGMDDHISKPVRLDELFAALRKWLSRWPDGSARTGTR